MTFFAETDRVISLDEIGIATARHGDFVLRSAFQMIFRPAGDGLRAVAAESFLRPFKEGLPLPPRPFLVSLATAERAFVERVAVALHLANHGHVGVEGVDHMLGLGSAFGAPDEAAVAVAGHLASAPSPSRLVCSLRATAGLGISDLAALAQALRGRKIAFALTGAAGEQPPLDTIRDTVPDIVRIDGVWFRQVAASESALRLLTSLVAAFQEHGSEVLVEGIETRSQLAAALDCGADLLQGFLLARPQLAGMAVEPAEIALGDILPATSQVIPLFGNGR